MVVNEEFFVIADNSVGHFSATAEIVELHEPDEPSEVLVQTREEYLADG